MPQADESVPLRAWPFDVMCLVVLTDRFDKRYCRTTVPVHAGEDLKPGTLRAIERDLEPCLGEHWLRKR